MLMEWRSRGDVWFATLEEIANHVLNCERAGTYKPRVDQVPFYDARVPLHQAKLRPA
jgi:hypothetical protein